MCAKYANLTTLIPLHKLAEVDNDMLEFILKELSNEPIDKAKEIVKEFVLFCTFKNRAIGVDFIKNFSYEYSDLLIVNGLHHVKVPYHFYPNVYTSWIGAYAFNIDPNFLYAALK
jgi:hypothetical protein